MKADVYRNLHKNCMSVRSREKTNYGRVVEHSNYVYLTDCLFVVNQRGRLRVLIEKRKNVHAFIRGEVVVSWGLSLTWSFPLDGWTRVSYNPYRHDKFFVFDDGRELPAYEAKKVLIVNNKVYAKHISLGVSF